MSDPRTPEFRLIQIAATGAAGQPDVVYGLGNDGSVWRLTAKLGHDIWVLLPAPSTAVPQPADVVE